MKDYLDKLKEIEGIDAFDLTKRGLVNLNKEELEGLYNQIEKTVERLQLLKITISMVIMGRE
ncbi:MAG: hypothetical protein ACRCW9_04030 [Cetobacterium sp.]